MTIEDNVFLDITVGDTRKFINEYLDKFSDDDSDITETDCYFGIIACSCLFESLLEEFVTSWCRIRGSNTKDVDARLMEKVGNDVSKSTGLNVWKIWMSTLFDIDISKELGEDWKSLTYLFRLRNQLAHGRTTKFTHYYNESGKFLGMTTEGSGYMGPVQFLLEKEIVVLATGEVPSTRTFLNKRVVLFFRSVVKDSISKLSKCDSLSGIKKYL